MAVPRSSCDTRSPTGRALKALQALEAIGYKPTVPVKLIDFADPNIREGWIRDKGMMVFQMYSDQLRTVGVTKWFVHRTKLLGFTLDFVVVINGRGQRSGEEGAAGILDEGSEKANRRGVTSGGS